VARTGGKGRGVYATGPFAPGERIERVPVIVIPSCQREYVEESFLTDYLFCWGRMMAVALGLGSLYNHSYQPNARYVKHFTECMVDFVALRDIAVGEEIVVNYNGDPTCTDPMWFEVKAHTESTGAPP